MSKSATFEMPDAAKHVSSSDHEDERMTEQEQGRAEESKHAESDDTDDAEKVSDEEEGEEEESEAEGTNLL